MDLKDIPGMSEPETVRAALEVVLNGGDEGATAADVGRVLGVMSRMAEDAAVWQMWQARELSAAWEDGTLCMRPYTDEMHNRSTRVLAGVDALTRTSTAIKAPRA